MTKHIKIAILPFCWVWIFRMGAHCVAQARCRIQFSHLSLHVLYDVTKHYHACFHFKKAVFSFVFLEVLFHFILFEMGWWWWCLKI